MDFARQKGMNLLGEKNPIIAIIKNQLIFFPKFANFWISVFLIFCFSLLKLGFFKAPVLAFQ